MWATTVSAFCWSASWTIELFCQTVSMVWTDFVNKITNVCGALYYFSPYFSSSLLWMATLVKSCLHKKLHIDDSETSVPVCCSKCSCISYRHMPEWSMTASTVRWWSIPVSLGKQWLRPFWEYSAFSCLQLHRIEQSRNRQWTDRYSNSCQFKWRLMLITIFQHRFSIVHYCMLWPTARIVLCHIVCSSLITAHVQIQSKQYLWYSCTCSLCSAL